MVIDRETELARLRLKYRALELWAAARVALLVYELKYPQESASAGDSDLVRYLRGK